ncbi:Piwi-domain-containing protein [Phlebopus sp. FC_14]|nr:Piwi-domain-containing protein [Phlebopus sp. FC_14]
MNVSLGLRSRHIVAITRVSTQTSAALPPSVSPARRRIEIFERLQNHTAPGVFTPKVIYDSDAICYASRVLPFGNSATFTVNMSDRSLTDPSGGRGIFTVKLTRVDAADINFKDLAHILEGRTAQQSPKVLVAINLIQLILRQAPNLRYANNVKSFFTRQAGSKRLGGGLEVYKGFYQSVRPTAGQLLVNIDVSAGVMYQEGPLLDVALAVMGAVNVRNLALPEGAPQFNQLRRFFKGVFVNFLHRKGRKKVVGIVPRAGYVEFEREKDSITQTCNIQQYFREVYNRNINPDLFGVQLGRGSIVPAELCVIMPDQRFKSKLPPDLIKGMVEFTSEKPHARLATITHGIQGDQSQSVLDYANSPFVRESGLEISASPVTIDGRVLKVPGIQYGSASQPVPPRFGAWNATRQTFFTPMGARTWAVIDFCNSPAQKLNGFVQMLVGCCQKLGMSINPQPLIKSGSGHDVVRTLDEVVKTLSSAGNPDLLLVVLPSQAAEIRFAVKQYGDVLRGIVTQCVRQDKIARANDQYCNNVAMKINAKLGGINCIPQSDMLKKLAQQPYMIMGADIGHPAPGMSDQPSIASLVWSHDRAAVQYESISAVQAPRLEAIQDLQEMVKHAIFHFGTKNPPPQRIVFFRDGLSEGEYATVAKNEIQDIQAAIDTIWEQRRIPASKPKLTFIVVGKRHHVRFFPANPNDGDKSGNCPAGFVADHGIGNPIAKDFYLQSHGGLLGTSRPSHYIVLKDDNFGNNVDVVQELAFALCHSYARATRSVSIPAPVYYADIVCSRAHFHFDPRLHYDQSAASVSSGDNKRFDLAKWKRGWQGKHASLVGKMNFM